MKKQISFLIICLLLLAPLLPSAFALEAGEYTWREHTIRLIEVQENPMLAPADMKDGDRAIGLRLEVPEAIASDEALSHTLYEAARLTDESGQSYKPGAALAKDNVLTYLFAVPEALELSTLRLMFEGEAKAAGNLKAFVGDWEGQSGDIHLSFTVREDGSGQYAFDQAGYHESYVVKLNADDNTFTVDIPKDNTLSIVSCKGTWQYADEVLTLNVVTTFASGRQFKYSIPCKRKVDPNARSLSDALALAGQLQESVAAFWEKCDQKEYAWLGRVPGYDMSAPEAAAVLRVPQKQFDDLTLLLGSQDTPAVAFAAVVNTQFNLPYANAAAKTAQTAKLDPVADGSCALVVLCYRTDIVFVTLNGNGSAQAALICSAPEVTLSMTPEYVNKIAAQYGVTGECTVYNPKEAAALLAQINKGH